VARILVTRRLPGDAVDKLVATGHDVDDGAGGLTREALLSRIAGCDAVICQLSEQIDSAVLDAAGPQLQIVSNYAVGVNNIDLAACRERGIVVGHTPGVLTEATADLAWTLLLAAARWIVEGDRMVRSGTWSGWQPDQLLGADLVGARLAIIGPGRIGTSVARRSVGWRMDIVYVGRRSSPELESLGASRVTIDEAFATADVISLHVPLNDQTHHLVDAQLLATMKGGAILVNTARGAVVDEAALVDALNNGPIGAAGLDVYEEEPRVHPGLSACTNAVLAPHLGSATRQTRRKMAEIAVANVLGVFDGEGPLHSP